MKNNKLKIISVVVLTLLAVGLIVFTVYYLISNKDTNKVTSTPYHVLNNQWHNYAEGITFDY